ncbi:hypothetical protein BC629DRAFT_1081455 [Irpex lacteus]|nr:hypothetical protein BC629DRAFT_1081455 [Irpex lacteus]
MDAHQKMHSVEAGEQIDNDQAAITKVAHIITQSLGKNTQGDSPDAIGKAPWARTAGAMIEHFGGLKAEELGPEPLHSPMNAFTATETAHVCFDELRLWLTPVKDMETGTIVPNTYNVECTSGAAAVLPHLKRPVTFQECKVNGIVIPPPHPKLFALHAACARIANMSGAAEYIEDTFWDPAPIAVMTEPNAANELTRALTVIRLISGERGSSNDWMSTAT